MLVDGYLDADGVQDVYFEAKASVEALLAMRAGKPVPAQILDPGFVIQQTNLKDKAGRCGERSPGSESLVPGKEPAPGLAWAPSTSFSF